MATSPCSSSAPELAASAARCRHFGACGGCSIQDRPYEAQLALKEARLKELLADAWPGPLPVRPSPEPWYYRNKMEFSFTATHDWDPATRTRTPRGDTLGFKRKGRWDEALDLKECFLLSPEAPALLESVRSWAKAEGLKAYDLRAKRGFLRHLVVREGKNTGQRLVMLVTAPGEIPESSFVEAVRRAYPATTVLWGVNPGASDAVNVPSPKVLYGPGTIEERLRLPDKEFLFRVSPSSFFQTNTRATEGLYGLLREKVRRAPPRELWDLYGGCGGIAFTAADLVEKIVSVELIESASADSRANAVMNGISNVDFICAKVEDWLPKVEPERLKGVTLLLDPPRAGLHPKVVKALLALRPERLLYVSCNPKIFAGELKALRGAWRLESLEALDLFPHTEHVELVAELAPLMLSSSNS